MLPAQTPDSQMEQFIGCPFSGTYRDGKPVTGKYLALNLRKNRFDSPTRFDPSITLAAMLKRGDDTHRWPQDKILGGRIHGYVAFVIKNFEGESCNCFKTDDAHSDTHIDIVANPDDAFVLRRHVIVEVTPRMKYLAKKRGLDWSTRGLEKQFLHKWVDVEGWLMWDWGHIGEAENTHPNDPSHSNWRATCWEIHPVTNIRLTRK